MPSLKEYRAQNQVHDSGSHRAASISTNLAYSKWLADNNPYFNHAPLTPSEIEYNNEDEIQMG